MATLVQFSELQPTNITNIDYVPIIRPIGSGSAGYRNYRAQLDTFTSSYASQSIYAQTASMVIYEQANYSDYGAYNTQVLNNLCGTAGFARLLSFLPNGSNSISISIPANSCSYLILEVGGSVVLEDKANVTINLFYNGVSSYDSITMSGTGGNDPGACANKYIACFSSKKIMTGGVGVPTLLSMSYVENTGSLLTMSINYMMAWGIS